MSRIQFTETRHYTDIGLRHAGDVADVPDALASQLVAQRFAVPLDDQPAADDAAEAPRDARPADRSDDT